MVFTTPTSKEVEVTLFSELQTHFQVLEKLDILLMESRDHKRLAYHEKLVFTTDTLFGPITINQRKYIDRETSECRFVGSKLTV